MSTLAVSRLNQDRKVGTHFRLFVVVLRKEDRNRLPCWLCWLGLYLQRPHKPDLSHRKLGSSLGTGLFDHLPAALKLFVSPPLVVRWKGLL
jgi:hypothetical protein